MNKEYMYVDGKVVILNENGMKTPIVYCDNIEDILITENLIEELEKKVDENQKKIERINSYNCSKINIIMPVLLFSIGSIVIPIFLTPLFGTNEIVETIFGTMHLSTLISTVLTPVFSFFGVMESLSLNLRDKNFKKEKKGYEGEIEFLLKELNSKKERLCKLQNEKNKTKESEFSKNSFSKKINDKDQLELLKTLSSFYYNCGVNEKRYLKYKENGTLKQELAKEQHDEFGVSLIENYLNEVLKKSDVEEKGQARVLKK